MARRSVRPTYSSGRRPSSSDPSIRSRRRFSRRRRTSRSRSCRSKSSPQWKVGVRGTVDRRIIEVISLRHARERSLELGSLGTDADRLAAQGRSPVICVVNNTVYTVIAIADPVKPTSRDAILQLKRLGLEVIMVPGDSRKGAEAVAAEMGIDEVLAEVLPSQKADLVRKLH